MSKTEIWGKRLGAILKEKNISQKVAAKIAGVQPSVLSGWLAGQSPQDFMAVKKLVDSLQISFTWLMTGAADKNEKMASISEIFEEQQYFDGYARIRIDRLVKRGDK